MNAVGENSVSLWMKTAAECVTGGERRLVEEIKRGEGAIVRQGASKIAVYRDEKGRLHARSAACTHSGGGRTAFSYARRYHHSSSRGQLATRVLIPLLARSLIRSGSEPSSR